MAFLGDVSNVQLPDAQLYEYGVGRQPRMPVAPPHSCQRADFGDNVDWTRLLLRIESSDCDFSQAYRRELQRRIRAIPGTHEMPDVSFDYVDILRVYELHQDDEHRGQGDVDGERYRLGLFELHGSTSTEEFILNPYQYILPIMSPFENTVFVETGSQTVVTARKV